MVRELMGKLRTEQNQMERYCKLRRNSNSQWRILERLRTRIVDRLFRRVRKTLFHSPLKLLEVFFQWKAPFDSNSIWNIYRYFEILRYSHRYSISFQELDFLVLVPIEFVQIESNRQVSQTNRLNLRVFDMYAASLVWFWTTHFFRNKFCAI